MNIAALIRRKRSGGNTRGRNREASRDKEQETPCLIPFLLTTYLRELGSARDDEDDACA